VPGGLVIEVKRLRVELTCKCFYLRLVNDVRSAGETLPHMQILEKKAIVRIFRLSIDHAAPQTVPVQRAPNPRSANLGMPAPISGADP
jgi:hypothetical protein